MKKIKLVALVGALILSAAGGYANYQMRAQDYYIEAGTSQFESFYPVALEEPSFTCGAPGFNNVCVVRAANGYQQGQSIPSYECIIISSYQ